MRAPQPFAIAFRRSTVLVILGALVLAFALAVVLVGDIARQQDAKASVQASRFVKVLLRDRQEQLDRVVVDYADWGTAYAHLHLTLDFEWAYTHNNIGRTLNEDLGIEYGAVIDPEGREIYSVVDGVIARPPAVLRLDGGAEALVEAARRMSPDGHGVASGILVDGGVPVLVAASILAPGDDLTVTPDARPPSILVFGDRLTEEEMAALRDDLFVEELHFSLTDAEADRGDAMQIASFDGSAAFALQVSAPTPGRDMLMALIPWFAVVAALLTLFVLVLARQGRRVAAMSRDAASALAEAHRLAEHQALHDTVTGLPNRVMFARRMHDSLARAPHELAILYLDLDHFKPVNDTFGHAAGDVVLRTIAGRLEEQLPKGDLCARIGGDEFVILVRQRDDMALRRLCRALIEVVSAPIVYGEETVTVGVSIGVARVCGKDTPEDAVRRADAALYEAKEAGRARFHWSGTPAASRVGAA